MSYITTALMLWDPETLDFITKPIFAHTFYICNSTSTLETFGIMILIESKVENFFKLLFQVFLLLLLLLLFYKQGAKQAMGRHSMGIGLGLFCWLYSRRAILSHSSSYTGQKNNRTHRGRITLVVSIQKNPFAWCLCLCLNSSTVNS